MRLEPRSEPSLAASAAAVLVALAIVAAVSLLLVSAAGASVGDAWLRIWDGAFGSTFAWTETLTRATPLILTGLAATVAFRARLFNIGAEGQLYIGAVIAVAVGGLHGGSGLDLPLPALAALMWACGAMAGGMALLGPAWLKVRLGVDEVVTTLLLNFIILLGVSALLDGPMKDPLALGWPQSVALNPELELQRLVPQTRLHTGFLLAIALAVLMGVMLRSSLLGFAIRALGANARAAAFAGVPIARTTVWVALLSGGLAGLAGVVEVAGRTGYLTLDMSPGYGYSGIVVAMLAALHPLGVVLSAVLVAGLMVGADSMSRSVGVPSYLADVVVATAMLAVLVAGFLMRYRIKLR